MTKQIIYTEAAPKSLAGYSQAVKAGGLIFVLGQGLSTRKQANSSEPPSKSKLGEESDFVGMNWALPLRRLVGQRSMCARPVA